MNILAELEKLRRAHHYCEDRWYTCPMHEEGCAAEREIGCNCGAEQHNATLDAIIAEAKSQEPVFIVFDGPPSHQSGRFVEVETADGKSIRAGEWTNHEKVQGLCCLGPFYTAPPAPQTITSTEIANQVSHGYDPMRGRPAPQPVDKLAEITREATDYMHAVSVLFDIQPEGDCLAERKPTKDDKAYRAFMYLNDQGVRLRDAIARAAPPAPQPVDEPPEWLIELCMITEAVTPTTDIRGTVQKLIDWHVAMELASLKEPKP